MQQNKPHKVLISTQNIHVRVQEVAREIERRYPNGEDVVLVCVLNGAKPFAQALSDALHIPHRVASIRVSSYGVGTYLSNGNVTVKSPLDMPIDGAHVVVVEDIIDTGYSMQKVLTVLADHQPATVEVCALLSKPSRRKVDVPVDYLGFSIEDHFVFGYGIDVDEQHRELAYIGYFE